MFCFSACDGRSKETKIVHQLEREIFNEINEKFGLFSVGFSKEAPKNDLKKCKHISLTFGTYRILSKDEGRRILFEISDAFIKSVNNHKELQEYMTDWPITEKNFGASIIVYNTPNVDWNFNNVKFFYITDKGVRFSYEIPNESFYKQVERETLEEARAKLK
jgi:hypothetical protein